MLESSADFYHRLVSLKIPALMVRQSVDDVLDSFVQIGTACHAEDAGARLAESIRRTESERDHPRTKRIAKRF